MKKKTSTAAVITATAPSRARINAFMSYAYMSWTRELGVEPGNETIYGTGAGCVSLCMWGNVCIVQAGRGRGGEEESAENRCHRFSVLSCDLFLLEPVFFWASP